MGVFDPDKLRDRIRLERKVVDDAFDSNGSEEWEAVVTVWAEVEDVLPSRGERLAEGLNIANSPARIRLYRRRDIDGAMRIVFGDRVMQIVAGPAVIGKMREGMELMAEAYSTAGGR